MEPTQASGELRPAAAAAILGITVKELRRASDRRDVPVKRITFGGERRYDRAVIERLARERETA